MFDKREIKQRKEIFINCLVQFLEGKGSKIHSRLIFVPSNMGEFGEAKKILNISLEITKFFLQI